MHVLATCRLRFTTFNILLQSPTVMDSVIKMVTTISIDHTSE